MRFKGNGGLVRKDLGCTRRKEFLAFSPGEEPYKSKETFEDCQHMLTGWGTMKLSFVAEARNKMVQPWKTVLTISSKVNSLVTQSNHSIHKHLCQKNEAMHLPKGKHALSQLYS